MIGRIWKKGLILVVCFYQENNIKYIWKNKENNINYIWKNKENNINSIWRKNEIF